MKREANTLGQQCWVVHRAHLHKGLVKVAHKSGAKVIVDLEVTKSDYQDRKKVNVSTERRKPYIDFSVGYNGIHSVVRRTTKHQARISDFEMRIPGYNAI